MGVNRNSLKLIMKGIGFMRTIMQKIVQTLTMALFVAITAPVTANTEKLVDTWLDSVLSSDGEQQILQLVSNAIENGGEGSRSLLKEKVLVKLSLEETMRIAEENSIALAIASKRVDIARLSVEKENANLDLSYSLSLNHNKNRSFERSEVISRFYTPTPPPSPQMACTLTDGSVDYDVTEAQCATLGGAWEMHSPCVYADDVLINKNECIGNPVWRTASELANSDSKVTDKTWQSKLGISQPFWWGGNVGISLNSKWHEKYVYTVNGIDIIADHGAVTNDATHDGGKQNDPFLLGKTFRWTSGYALSFNTPLPNTKNFGEFGSLSNVAITQANLAEKRSRFNLNSSKNSLIAAVNSRYWQLVQTVMELHVAIESKRLSVDMLAHVKRLYDKRQTTEYGLKQAEAEYEYSLNREELAWSDYQLKSNALVELLELETDKIILPTEYISVLDGSSDNELVDALSTLTVLEKSLKQRDDLAALRISKLSSEIALKHQKNQVLPDIALSVSTNGSQSDAIMGYESWSKSFKHLLDADSTNNYIGLQIKIPFGNTVAKKQLSQARISKQQTVDQLQSVENTIVQQVNSSLGTLRSREHEISLSRTNLQLATMAYQQAERMGGKGLVSEFEQLEKQNDLLAARSGYLSALVNYQMADIELKAVQGIWGGNK